MSEPAVSGAELVCATLAQAGVDCVFGLPGTQTVGLYEALRRSPLRSIVATHELSAAMMANGYYRASGRIAALLTIPGPGFTWALTGLAEASLDSAALLHLTMQPAHSPGRQFQLQALDQAAIAGALSKGQYRVDHATDIAPMLASAHAQAGAGEPGPVLVQFTRDALRASAPPADVAPPSPPLLDEAAFDAVLATLRHAGRCMLLLGQGCNAAAGLATQLAETLCAAVVTTTSGRGVVAEDHPLSLGFAFAGNEGGTLNALVEASDVVLAIGCKFSHNGSRGFELRLPPDKLIHVDAGTAVLGANYPARHTLCADATAFLQALLQRLEAKPDRAGFSHDEIAQWRRRADDERDRRRVEPRIHGVDGGQAQAFFAALRQALPRHGCLLTDSGQHQGLARRHFPVLCPRGLIVPTNLQSMGFGIGAAIGACLADPARPVVALIGDGGLAMSGLELLTAVREGLRLTVIVFVDGAYGLIRMQQLAGSGHAHGTEFDGPDLAALAEAVGATHVRLDGDAQATLSAAIRAPGVTLVEVRVGDSLPMHWLRTKSRVRGSRLRAWWRRRRR
jgi:acetolactate synthase-1/2/3 large subunit